jgi:hypothetical protein
MQPDPSRTSVAEVTSPPPPPYEEILTLACRAPSVHNTQPWVWRLKAHGLELFADYTRHLLHADPDGRDLLLSCGAVLHHAQVVAAGLGWATRVNRLPDPRNDHLLATLTFSPTALTPEASALLQAATARQTDRRRFTSWPVPDERLHTLSAIGSRWGAQVLPVPGEWVRGRLRELTLRADRMQRADPSYLRELQAWTREGRDGVRKDDVPSAASAVDAEDTLGRRFPEGSLPDPVIEQQDGEDQMLIVCTPANDTMSCLCAGEAMSAVWLHATKERLAVVPLSQALEVPETRDEIQEVVLGSLAFPQIILRLGWLSTGRSELPRSGRRDLGEVLVRSE